MGLTLNFAIDRYIEVAVTTSSGPVSLLAVDTGEIVEAVKVEAGKTATVSHEARPWAMPMLEVLEAFQKQNLSIPTFQAAFTGTLPMSAGLCTRTALATALALALDHLAGTNLSAFEMAQIGGHPEMLPILLAKHECALKLDWRTEEHICIPLRINPYRFLLALLPAQEMPLEELVEPGAVDSATRDWETAWAKIRALRPGVGSPQDLQEKDLERFRLDLTVGEYSRIFHLLEENRHILEAEKCLLAGDLERFGTLLSASSRSRNSNWLALTPQSQTLMELSMANDGVIGGTPIGDGSEAAFLSLVHRDSVEEFTASVQKGFRRQFGPEPSVIECNPSDGASVSEGFSGVESHPGWSPGGMRASSSGLSSGFSR